MYLTPKRLRHMGLGVNLSARSDAELAEHIRNASAMVDAYCNVPTIPQPHSFKGGSIVGEKHGYGLNNRTGRIYPYHGPVKSVSRFRILATESLYIDFPNASDYFINEALGYIEIINFALTKIGLWGQANVPQMGLIDPVAVLDYEYGRSIPVVDDEVYSLPNPSGEADYTDYMAADGFWDLTAPVTVKADGVEVTSGFTLDRSGGFVKFDAPRSATEVITLSYTGRLPHDIARATALGTLALIGESALAAVNMTGIESIKAEELEIRRIGSRAGAERGVDLPMAAQRLLDGYNFLTVRGSD